MATASKHFSLLTPHARPSGKLEVTAPYDGALIATIDNAAADTVEQALQTAWQLYRNRDGWLSETHRIAVLERTATLMQEAADELAVEAAREGGKPLLDSKIEVARAIDGVRECVEFLRTGSVQQVPMGINSASEKRVTVTLHEPVGVVVAVSAFNHPLNLIVHQVAPAVAVGCPVIVKPATDTPLSCFRFVQLLHQAGLPEEWCQALAINEVEVASKLVTDARVGFFSFIGSARVGWMLRSQLAPGTRCALEHGGAAPVLIAEDADLETMLPLLVKGGFYHAGQVCVSVQRVYAHERIAEQVAQGLAEQAQKLRIGDPVQEQTEVGPLIRPVEVERVSSWIEEAVQAGGRRLCGGDRLSESCYPCTVLLDPPDTAKVSRQEIFGPAICVYSCPDLDQALERANALPYAFQAAVFTQNIDRALRCAKRLDASAVMINDHTAFRVDWMPFAGLRESGLGVGGIPHTMEEMQIRKMLVFRSEEL